MAYLPLVSSPVARKRYTSPTTAMVRPWVVGLMVGFIRSMASRFRCQCRHEFQRSLDPVLQTMLPNIFFSSTPDVRARASRMRPASVSSKAINDSCGSGALPEDPAVEVFVRPLGVDGGVAVMKSDLGLYNRGATPAWSRTAREVLIGPCWRTGRVGSPGRAPAGSGDSASSSIRRPARRGLNSTSITRPSACPVSSAIASSSTPAAAVFMASHYRPSRAWSAVRERPLRGTTVRARRKLCGARERSLSSRPGGVGE